MAAPRRGTRHIAAPLLWLRMGEGVAVNDAAPRVVLRTGVFWLALYDHRRTRLTQHDTSERRYDLSETCDRSYVFSRNDRPHCLIRSNIETNTSHCIIRSNTTIESPLRDGERNARRDEGHEGDAQGHEGDEGDASDGDAGDDGQTEGARKACSDKARSVAHQAGVGEA